MPVPYKIPKYCADIAAGTITPENGWIAVDILIDADATGNATVTFTGETGKSFTLKPGQSRFMTADNNGGGALSIVFAAGCSGSYVIWY